MYKDLTEVLEWVRTVNPKTLPYDIISVGWGPKFTNGVPTGENSLIFTVREKKSIEELDVQKIIPSTLNVQNIEVVTDVQKAVLNQLYVDCHTISDFISPVKDHRVKCRPLSGGTEAVVPAPLPAGFYSVATLGMFVIDKADGQVAALSNNHVFGAIQAVASANLRNSFNKTNIIDLSGYQPTGVYASVPNGGPDDYIGTTKINVPFGNQDSSFLPGWGLPMLGYSSCDAALLKLKDNSLINSSSVNIINFSQKGPYVWATDSEIDSLLNPVSPNFRSPAFKAGRTTGPVGFPGYQTTTCQISVYKFDASPTFIGGPDGYASIFTNCFYVSGNVDAGAGGDSGSVYFSLLSSKSTTASAWKVIGLLFAGNTEVSIGCRITSISSALNIAPWSGVIPTLSSTFTVALADTLSSPTVTLSGRTFYQLGSTISRFAQQRIY